MTTLPTETQPIELFRFQLWRALKPPADEVVRVRLCPDCAERLAALAWAFVCGKVSMLNDQQSEKLVREPGGVM